MGKAEARRSQSLRLSWATELDTVKKKKTEKKKEKRKNAQEDIFLSDLCFD